MNRQQYFAAYKKIDHYQHEGKIMKEQTIRIYKIDELPEEMQEKAHEEYLTSESFEYFWMDENMDSIKAFTDLFGANVTEYQIGEWISDSFIRTDVNQDTFRGVKPSTIPDSGCPLTGYYIDDTLLTAFHNHAGKDGDIKGAFEYAIDVAIEDIVADMESQRSLEYFIQHASANEWEFLETGEFYK